MVITPNEDCNIAIEQYITECWKSEWCLAAIPEPSTNDSYSGFGQPEGHIQPPDSELQIPVSMPNTLFPLD